MARSNSSRWVFVAALCALGHLLLAQLAAFVTPLRPSSASGRQLRSRVSLAATAADVAAAKEKMTLLAWAANNLASEGSPQAPAMQAKADAAVAEYEALKNGEAPPAAAAPAAPAPVAAAPAPAVPIASAAVPSAVSDADIADAKEKAKLLSWAAKTLAGEGSPQAPAMQAKADAAVAQFEALKAAKENGQAAPAAVAPAAPAPVAAAPAPAAPVAAAPSAVSEADLAAAKKNAQLLSWAANTLASEGSPQAPAMQAKADAAVAELEAMKAAQSVAAR